MSKRSKALVARTARYASHVETIFKALLIAHLVLYISSATIVCVYTFVERQKIPSGLIIPYAVFSSLLTVAFCGTWLLEYLWGAENRERETVRDVEEDRGPPAAGGGDGNHCRNCSTTTAEKENPDQRNRNRSANSDSIPEAEQLTPPEQHPHPSIPAPRQSFSFSRDDSAETILEPVFTSSANDPAASKTPTASALEEAQQEPRRRTPPSSPLPHSSSSHNQCRSGGSGAPAPRRGGPGSQRAGRAPNDGGRLLVPERQSQLSAPKHTCKHQRARPLSTAPSVAAESGLTGHENTLRRASRLPGRMRPEHAEAGAGMF